MSGVAVRGELDPWEACDARYTESLVRTHLALLTDLSRPESRDALVRWGIAREMEAWTWGSLRPLTNPDAIARKWHARRDDPEGLERAARALVAPPSASGGKP